MRKLLLSSEASAQATAADSKQLDRLIAAFERIRDNYVAMGSISTNSSRLPRRCE